MRMWVSGQFRASSGADMYPAAVAAIVMPLARSLIAALSSGKQLVRWASWSSSRSHGLRLSMAFGRGRLQCMDRVVFTGTKRIYGRMAASASAAPRPNT